MSDPHTDVAEKVAEKVYERESIKLEGRLDAHAAKLRENQIETIDRAGLPADLVATEANVWKRLTAGRNRWPEIAAFDERVAELEQRQAAVADELRELRDRELAAPATDAERLAAWHLEAEKGPRPEPELPAVKERIEQRQADWEAFTRATQQVLDEKAGFVAKHRGRLVTEADDQTAEAHRRYLDLIDQAAEARQDLFLKRRAAVWARLYPSQESAFDVADTFAGGRAKPLKAMGVGALVAAERVLDALKADADWLREAATAEQRFAMEGRDPRQPPSTVWDQTDEGQQWQRDERQRALDRLSNPQ